MATQRYVSALHTPSSQEGVSGVRVSCVMTWVQHVYWSLFLVEVRLGINLWFLRVLEFWSRMYWRLISGFYVHCTAWLLTAIMQQQCELPGRSEGPNDSKATQKRKYD